MRANGVGKTMLPPQPWTLQCSWSDTHRHDLYRNWGVALVQYFFGDVGLTKTGHQHLAWIAVAETRIVYEKETQINYLKT
jgi:hypothetical protein